MIQTTYNTLHLELLLAKHEITDLESTRNRLLDEFEDTFYELEREKEQNILLQIKNKQLNDMIKEIGDTAKKMKKLFNKIKRGHEE